MKVAFLGTNDPFLDRYPPGGGIEHQVWALARSMADRGHEVHILTKFRRRTFESLESIQIHGVPSEFPNRVISALRFSLASRRLLNRLNPDVIYLAEKLTSFVVSKTDCPKAYYTHNKDTFRDYRVHARPSQLRTALGRIIEDYVMGGCNLIVCPTEGYRTELAERGFTNTIAIPTGVHASDYQNLGDHNFVFFSGQLHKVKRLDCLLEAFAAIHSEFPGYRLVIGGDGPERHRLEEQARALRIARHVRFRPWCGRSELLKEFGTCSVYVLPSLAEMFPVVVMEAMASGKAVIASDINGPRDAIRHGIDGLLFEPGATQELADCLRRLLSDVRLRARMGASGRKRVAESYDINRISLDMERALASVVA